MEKYRKNGIYALCILCGIYTADMIYRFIRYICTFCTGDIFEGMILLLGNIFEDGSTFMILSAVCCVLMAVCGFVFKVFKKRTLVFLAVNALISIIFMILTSNGEARMEVVLHGTALTVPVYLLSGLWCIYFSIKDLCKYFLNNNYEEIN